MNIYLAGGGPDLFVYPPTNSLMHEFQLKTCEAPRDADVFASNRLKPLLRWIIRYPRKRFLIWTNEPRYSVTLSDRLRLRPLRSSIEVMNVFGCEVFWHPLHFLGSFHFGTLDPLSIDLEMPLTPVRTSRQNGNRPIVAVYSNRQHERGRCVIGGIDRDLERTRVALAIRGHQRGLVDIVGSGWPTGMAMESSGFGQDSAAVPWHRRKLDILSRYRFNICLENTTYGFYVTEKIWHSIAAGCLPIYWGRGNHIGDIFPRHSFVDAAQFESPDELFDAVAGMSDSEWCDRYNACVEVFNFCTRRRRESIQWEPRQHLQRVVDRLG